ncbi:hypothetical protein L596_023103 [Steinernema carpocapsae]|uniref:Uncharacterized protein n=1 Tax=Steinernema carpocapsae TaxID=34508 RepID=A0A4U5MCP2_STECR|nr:hypothetical protein L596_023103 [Steinernema carpocapsae]
MQNSNRKRQFLAVDNLEFSLKIKKWQRLGNGLILKDWEDCIIWKHTTHTLKVSVNGRNHAEKVSVTSLDGSRTEEPK